MSVRYATVSVEDLKIAIKMLRLYFRLSVSLPTVAITATVADGRVEKNNPGIETQKNNHNSRSLKHVLQPSGYLQRQPGLQIDGPLPSRPPSFLDPNAESSSASVSSTSVVSDEDPAVRTYSNAGRGKTKTRTLLRHNKQVPMSKNAEGQKIAKSGSRKMLGHGRPWSALQSAIDLRRKAADSMHSLLPARPSAFYSSETHTQNNETSNNSTFTVEEACEWHSGI